MHHRGGALFIGAILLAVALGLGGGIIRDLLLGLRPVAVTSRHYLPTAAVAAAAGYMFSGLMRRFSGIFVVLEALSVDVIARRPVAIIHSGSWNAAAGLRQTPHARWRSCEAPATSDGLPHNGRSIAGAECGTARE